MAATRRAFVWRPQLRGGFSVLIRIAVEHTLLSDYPQAIACGPLMWPKRFIACDITINLLMLLTIMNYIIRYVAECPDQLCISELADHGIAGAAESDGADMPRASRQDLGSAQRGRRTLAFFRNACDGTAVVVFKKRHRHVVCDVRHDFFSSRGAALAAG
jgi:hypothetical protein